MGRKFTKISAEAFKSMQINAGLVLNTFDTEGQTAVADADIICATTGGITATCTPNITDLGEDVDNCQKNTVELMEIEDYDCTLAFTALNTSAEVIRMALGAADVAGGKVTPRMTFKTDKTTGDFKTIWFVGDLIGGGYVAVRLDNAISTGGLSLKTTDKGKGNVSVTMTGCVRMGDETVPMEFFVSEDAAA